MRKPLLRYRRLGGKLRLVIVSDSAFTAISKDGLALRGYFVLIVEAGAVDHPGGLLHVIDYVSRKQSHVCRATFAAELFALLDAIGAGLKIAAVLEEMSRGAKSAAALADVQDSGKYAMELHGVIDAKSVYDVVAQERQPKPTEEHLTVHVLKLKEFLNRGILRKLWWCDTRDMIADGLTKGVVDRSAILRISEQGEWHLQHPAIGYPKR